MSQRWNQFWFALRSSESLAIVRILFVGTFVMKLMGTWGLYKGWAGLRFRLPHFQAWNYGEYPFPVPGFEWLPTPTDPQWDSLYSWELFFAMCFCVGLGTRITGKITALGCILYLLGSQFNYLHHVNVYAWFLTILAFAPCSDHYSVDAWLKRWWARLKGVEPTPPPKRMMVSLRLLAIVLSLLYISTTYAKLTPLWINGEYLALLHSERWLKGPWVAPLLTVIPLSLLCWWTIFAEGMLGFGLWFRPTRRFTAWCGVMLHMGIDTMMNVTTFSYAMAALYFVFMEPESGRNKGQYDPSRRSHLLGVAVIKALDWGRRTDLRPAEPGTGFVLHTTRKGARTGAAGWLAALGMCPLPFPVLFPVESLWLLVERVRAR